MIVRIAADGQSLVQRCSVVECSHERTLQISLGTAGSAAPDHLRMDEDALATGDTVGTPPCPKCGAVEWFRLDVAPYEAGEVPQPGTRVGERLPSGGVVHEHTVGWSASGELLAQARLLRRLANHPQVAARRVALHPRG